MTLEDGSRKLGSTGPNVFPLALGCMGMSGMYGWTDDQESIATIHAALDCGVTLLDAGDFLARIEEAMPSAAVAGGRYDEQQMKMLDSEQGKGSFC